MTATFLAFKRVKMHEHIKVNSVFFIVVINHDYIYRHRIETFTNVCLCRNSINFTIKNLSNLKHNVYGNSVIYQLVKFVQQFDNAPLKPFIICIKIRGQQIGHKTIEESFTRTRVAEVNTQKCYLIKG